jgi:hypothetical protein
MSPETTEQPARTPPPTRRRAPKWAVPAFLALLVLLVVVNHFVERSGTPVAWIENDLDRAFVTAQEQEKRVFLYVYDPATALHSRNESEVFTKFWARGALAQAVCCRVDVTKHPNIGLRYRYAGTPLMLVLAPTGRELARVDGEIVEERQFSTYISGFIVSSDSSKP